MIDDREKRRLARVWWMSLSEDEKGKIISLMGRKLEFTIKISPDNDDSSICVEADILDAVGFGSTFSEALGLLGMMLDAFVDDAKEFVRKPVQWKF